MRRCILLLALSCAASQWLAAAPPQVLEHVQSGHELSLPNDGSGEATLYLFGPCHVAKRTVKLGAPVNLTGEDLACAVRYVVVLNGESFTFFVTAGPVASVAFIARPSRVPASTRDVVSGTAFLFDRNQNLVLSPQPVSIYPWLCRVRPKSGGRPPRTESPGRGSIPATRREQRNWSLGPAPLPCGA